MYDRHGQADDRAQLRAARPPRRGGAAVRRRRTSSATRSAATRSTAPCCYRMLSLSGVLNSIPMGGFGIRVIVAALYEWQRKSELSADRAGLLATQDPATAFRVHMKLACGSGDLAELDQTSFFAQGQEYLDSGDLRDSVLKLLLIERAVAPVRRRTRGRAAPLGRLGRLHAGSWPAPTRAARTTPARACRRRPSRPPTQLHRGVPELPGRPRASSSTTRPAVSAAPSSGSTTSCAATATDPP